MLIQLFNMLVWQESLKFGHMRHILRSTEEVIKMSVHCAFFCLRTEYCDLFQIRKI